MQQVILGLGTGVGGYDSYSLTRDGVIRAVSNPDPQEFSYVEATTQLSQQAAARLLDAPEILRCLNLNQYYSGEKNDGTQAFALVVTGTGVSWTWMNNAFPPEFSGAWNLLGMTVDAIKPTEWRGHRHTDGHAVYYSCKKAYITAKPSI